jgi:membrane fusion protein (multidrug efflux system)
VYFPDQLVCATIRSLKFFNSSVQGFFIMSIKAKAFFVPMIVLLIIVLSIAGLKFGQVSIMMNTFASMPAPTETVTTHAATEQLWNDTYTAVGTVEASEGIQVSAEVAGKVKEIRFKSGDHVKKGTVLVVQESGNEQGQLSAAEARLRLAKSNHERLVQLRKNNTVSQSELDTAVQQMESAQGEVDNLKTTLEKKIVRAPFDGRLGIRKVDLGEDLQVGTEIVSLQATNSVRVNFPVPQFWLVKMSRGLPVSVKLGDGSETVINGEVTAVGADINIVNRNATVQSYLINDKNLLIPGMAVNVTVTLADPQTVLAIPSTAIAYAPYGDTVFVIEPDDKNQLIARQQFVKLGRSQGDFVEILDGIKLGDKIAIAGAFRLINGQVVTISELPVPEFSINPTPADQ